MSARLPDRNFPQLQDQVRCSTGYTVARAIVLRLPPGWGDLPRTDTPARRDVSVSAKPKAKRGRRTIKGDL